VHAPGRTGPHRAARKARDRFATTPVALLIKDGIIVSAKDGDAAAPNPNLSSPATKQLSDK